jgi:hypothetical protein
MSFRCALCGVQVSQNVYYCPQEEYLPRQALFEKDGKPIVYVKVGSRFEAREVKIKNRSESRTAIDGLPEGTEVALVNPELEFKKGAKPGAAVPIRMVGGGW